VKSSVFAETRCEFVISCGTIPPSACSADTSLYTREGLGAVQDGKINCKFPISSAYHIFRRFSTKKYFTLTFFASLTIMIPGIRLRRDNRAITTA